MWPKSQGKNLNILRTEKAFEMKWKAFVIIFKGLSVAKNCLRPESVLLSMYNLLLDTRHHRAIGLTIVWLNWKMSYCKTCVYLMH